MGWQARDRTARLFVRAGFQQQIPAVEFGHRAEAFKIQHSNIHSLGEKEAISPQGLESSIEMYGRDPHHIGELRLCLRQAISIAGAELCLFHPNSHFANQMGHSELGASPAKSTDPF